MMTPPSEFLLSGQTIRALGDALAQAVTEDLEDEVIRLRYHAVPVGWLSSFLWRFIRTRIERFG